VKVRAVVQFQVNCTVLCERVWKIPRAMATMAELRKQLEEMQQALAQLHMGAKVTSFLESQQRNESDFETYKELKEFFDKSFCVTTNLVYARAKFNLRQQKAGETAQEYINCLIS
jgi:hypothetical protein